MDTTFSDAEIENCTLRNPREILFQIKGLIKRGEPISVLFQEGRQSFLTVLLEVAEDSGLLYFDIGGSEETNEAFLNSPQSTFVTHVEGIRYQFVARQGRRINWRNAPALAVPIPESLLRLQRRQFFRLSLPTTKPFVCRLARGTRNEKALPLHDISVGGIGIISPQPVEFEPLEHFENCWIDLHESGVLAVTLEVRHLEVSENRMGKKQWHVGFQFVRLSPLNDTLIQRFMARLQAERAALQTG